MCLHLIPGPGPQFWGEGPRKRTCKQTNQAPSPSTGFLPLSEMELQSQSHERDSTAQPPHTHTQTPPAATPAGITSPVQVQHLEIHRTTLVDGSSAQGSFFQAHGDHVHMTLGRWQRPTRVTIWLSSALHPHLSGSLQSSAPRSPWIWPL